MKIVAELYKSDKEQYKFKVIVNYLPTKKKDTVYFGANGYEDFTHHNDILRKTNYLARHKKRENWTKTGIDTSGFWSRWLLWNKNTLNSSIDDIQKQFDIKIINYTN